MDGSAGGAAGDDLAAAVRLLLDRQEISDLVTRYALGVDQRDSHGVASLFDVDGRLVVYPGPGLEPLPAVDGRRRIARALDGLARYSTTSHEIAGHVAEVDGDRATGVTRCVSVHRYGEPEEGRLVVRRLRYLDVYLRRPEGWRIAERQVRNDLVEDRPAHDRPAAPPDLAE